MFLGIEIGGTKLQLGVGAGDGSPLVELVRRDVDVRKHAAGILAQLESAAPALIARHNVSAIGIGFGGPVDSAPGRVVKSHHVEGWEEFPLVAWCRQTLGVPTVLHNDCDAACLAEARFGAGKGSRVVLYVTIGTGIGGGLVIDGKIYRGGGSGATEIGHLRPGLDAVNPDQTVELLASGWGIAAAARERLGVQAGEASFRGAKGDSASFREAKGDKENAHVADLLARCGGRLEELTTQLIGQAAGEGNEMAREVVAGAVQALGWGIAQALTLLSPNVVVIGGGVSLMDRSLFFEPLQAQVARFVFPPLAGHYRLAPADLGELVVVHGAVALAAE
jgi:glucokinase